MDAKNPSPSFLGRFAQLAASAAKPAEGLEQEHRLAVNYSPAELEAAQRRFEEQGVEPPKGLQALHG